LKQHSMATTQSDVHVPHISYKIQAAQPYSTQQPYNLESSQHIYPNVQQFYQRETPIN